MAEDSTRSRVPPINGEITAIERDGNVIWEGSRPAFVTYNSDWVETGSGARVALQTVELSFPTIEVAPDSEELPEDFVPPEITPDPDPDPDPDPPPPPAEGTDDYPYVPPVSPPDPEPAIAGTWQAALASMIGYGSDSSLISTLNAGTYSGNPIEDLWYPEGGAFRVGLGGNYWVSPTGGYTHEPPWHNPVNEHGEGGGQGIFSTMEGAGGLHWGLGPAPDGAIDQTGEGWHGSPAGGIALGNMPNKPRYVGAGATYFNGVDSRVVSLFNPWAVGAMLSTDPETEWHQAAYPVGSELFYGGDVVGSSPHEWETFPRHDGTRADIWWQIGHDPEYRELSDEGEGGQIHAPQNIRVPWGATEVTVSGWIRRQDTLHDHTLFTSSGPDSYRFYLPGTLDHPEQNAFRAPVFEAHPSEQDVWGDVGADEATWRTNTGLIWPCFPVNQNQWMHYAVRFGRTPDRWQPPRIEQLWVNGQLVVINRGGSGQTTRVNVRIPTNTKLVEGVGGVLETVAADHGGIVAGHATKSWYGGMAEFAVFVERQGAAVEDPGAPYYSPLWGLPPNASSDPAQGGDTRFEDELAEHGICPSWKQLYAVNPVTV